MADSDRPGWLKLQELLRPEFEILRLLGRGAMGSVYLAREPDLDRVVAIKVLGTGQRSENRRERIRTEARTVARLNHPNIVPLHRLMEVGPFVCFVMAMVHGESLGALLRRSGSMPAGETRYILTEIAGALDYAHRHGIVHRDVKPDNILIEDESGRPMLTDFGIARTQASVRTLDEQGYIIGTPAYMSPEQAAGVDSVDGRSDLYALGIVGYEMLTGSTPFQASQISALLHQHVHQQPPSLPSAVAPDDLGDILQRCLQKRPSDRWPDGASLREVLLSGVSRDGKLPAELEQLPWGGWTVILALGSILLPFVDLGTLDMPIRVLWIALGVACIVALFVARRRGFPWASIGRAALRQPKWWPGLWYPSRHRRNSDVWDRLPRPLRWGRTMFAGGAFIFLVTLVSIELIFASAARSSQSLNRLVNNDVFASFTRLHLLNTSGLVGPVLMVSGLFLANLWASRHGLDWKNKFLLFTHSTLDPDFWRCPEIAPLLKKVEPEESEQSEQSGEALTECVDEARTIERRL